MTKLTICMYGAASDRIDSIYINAAEEKLQKDTTS